MWICLVCVSGCWFQNWPVSVYYLWGQTFERDWPQDQRGNFSSRSALNVVKWQTSKQTWVQSCPVCQWNGVIFFFKCWLHLFSTQNWSLTFSQTVLIFDYCASKGYCIFSEALSTQILDCISSIYRVMSSLGDSSVPLNSPKWMQSPFGNPSAYLSHGCMFFSGSSCASWGRCFSHSCLSPLLAPGYSSPWTCQLGWLCACSLVSSRPMKFIWIKPFK